MGEMGPSFSCFTTGKQKAKLAQVVVHYGRNGPIFLVFHNGQTEGKVSAG